MDRNKFHYMSGAALFAGIMAVLSQFAFPVGAVPVTLQTFVCAFAGGVLGWNGARFLFPCGFFLAHWAFLFLRWARQGLVFS